LVTLGTLGTGKMRITWEPRTNVVDCDFHRNDITGFISGSSVVILAESHNIDTLGSKSRANGRSGCSLPSFKSQLYNSNHCTTQHKIQSKKIKSQILEVKQKLSLPFFAFPPGLGGAMAMTLKRLRIGAEEVKENLTEVEKNEEEEELKLEIAVLGW